MGCIWGRTAVYHLAGLRDEEAADLVQLQLLAEELGEAAVTGHRRPPLCQLLRSHERLRRGRTQRPPGRRLGRKANDPQLKIKGLIDWGLALWRRGELEVFTTTT
jgi:hypothetical protein